MHMSDFLEKVDYLVRNLNRSVPGAGVEIREFEKAMASYCGAPYVLALSSGTMALEIALRALDVGPEDEVILPTYDWGASLGAVIRVGARPVLADVDPSTATLAPQDLQKRITHRTAALIVTHLHGCPANMPEILRIAKAHSISVIEDCAQALGATVRNKPVGTWGDIGVFSFSPGKILTTGEGGMLVCKEKAIWEKAIWLSQHPSRQILETGTEGPLSDMATNGRMHPIAALIGLHSLPELHKRIEKRREACLTFSQSLKHLHYVLTPKDPPWGTHVFHRFVLLLQNKNIDIFISTLQKKWRINRGYIHRLHHRRSMFKNIYSPEEFPGAEKLWHFTLGLDLPWEELDKMTAKQLASEFKKELENVYENHS